MYYSDIQPQNPMVKVECGEEFAALSMANLMSRQIASHCWDQQKSETSDLGIAGSLEHTAASAGSCLENCAGQHRRERAGPCLVEGAV